MARPLLRRHTPQCARLMCRGWDGRRLHQSRRGGMCVSVPLLWRRPWCGIIRRVLPCCRGDRRGGARLLWLALFGRRRWGLHCGGLFRDGGTLDGGHGWRRHGGMRTRRIRPFALSRSLLLPVCQRAPRPAIPRSGLSCLTHSRPRFHVSTRTHGRPSPCRGAAATRLGGACARHATPRSAAPAAP